MPKPKARTYGIVVVAEPEQHASHHEKTGEDDQRASSAGIQRHARIADK